MDHPLALAMPSRSGGSTVLAQRTKYVVDQVHTPHSVAFPTKSATRRLIWEPPDGSKPAISLPQSDVVAIDGRSFPTDSHFNIPHTILSAVPRRLHLQPEHPLYLTRELIESRFPGYKFHNDFFPVVSTHQNFDSLGFPPDHPGRSKTDTYYVNEKTVLRTHTSAHQADVFRANESEGFLISADVYRRDAVDRSHYPVFHQMEGARMWDRRKNGGDVTEAVRSDLEKIPKHDLIVEDPNPTVHRERNPLQTSHSLDEVEAIVTHMKRSIEDVVVTIFESASEAAAAATGNRAASISEPLKVRWVEAYFPFTSPSWELEVFWQGDWLELLGCGVVKQDLFVNADVPDQLGWAFGIGLERIAMLLFDIPDIRLFWSKDERFLGQFKKENRTGGKEGGSSSGSNNNIRRYIPFSKYPPSSKDVAFWLRSTSSAGGGSSTNAQDFHENDFMEIVREVGGTLSRTCAASTSSCTRRRAERVCVTGSSTGAWRRR